MWIKSTLIHSNNQLKRSYLTKQTSIITRDTSTQNSIQNDLIDQTLEDKENDPSTLITKNNRVIQLEHHIVYSTSYQVPVLYFRAFHDSGSPLSLEEIYQHIIPPLFHETTVSQMEHPVLGIPCWYIHPCDTRQLMSTMQYESLDYIKSWLSVYGPIARCPINTDMFLQNSYQQ